MQITVSDLQDYLYNYDGDAIVKLSTRSSNGQSEVFDFSHITVSTEEVHGKEVVIHSMMED